MERTSNHASLGAGVDAVHTLLGWFYTYHATFQKAVFLWQEYGEGFLEIKP
jgi:hypothetical protein